MYMMKKVTRTFNTYLTVVIKVINLIMLLYVLQQFLLTVIIINIYVSLIRTC